MTLFGLIRSAILGAVLLGVAVVLALGGIISGVDVDTDSLWQVARIFGTMKFIEEKYVDEVDARTLADGAIKGMVKALGDPHSVYLDEGNYQKMKEQTGASFGGVGIVMGFPPGRVQVITVMEGTPAEAAGLLKDDEILAVDGQPVQDRNSEEIAASIRGKVGTKVRLLVRREGEPDREYELQRETIHVKTVASGLPEPGLGYIRISSFSEKTGDEFTQQYNQLLEDGMQGLIIDLRSNPGGLISSCVQIGNIVVPEGPIVSVVERDGTKEVHSSTHTGADIPLVVLIDNGSASASEILAGALQDTGAATIVGETSYGKGSVQVVMPIPGEDDAVKLTIAKYYTPSGRSIQGTGVTPDREVKLDRQEGYDAQLATALQTLQEKIQAANEATPVLDGKARNKDATQL